MLARTTTIEISTVDVVVTTPPTSLRISPQHVTMFVGGTRTFAVVDNLGRIPTGVVWSVDHGALATVDQGPPVSLTAVAAGELILTASWQGLTATTHITVVVTSESGTSVAETLWSAPPVNGAVQRIVRGAKRPGGPELTDMPPSAATAALIYTWESTGDDTSSDLIRAFAPDGTERWSASAGGTVLQLSGDSSGGVVALVKNYTDDATKLLLFGANGGQSQGPTGSGKFAIDPQGPLYYTPEPSETVPGNTLMSLDIGMGAGGSTSLPGQAGDPVVLGDGTVVVPSITGRQTFALTFLHPDGSTAEQPVTLPDLGAYDLGWAYRAIPNGRDGFLVQLMATRHDSHTYSGPGYEAFVVGVDAAGNYTGHTAVGDDWGEGDIVVLGDTAIATGYLWYESGELWNHTHRGMVTTLTLDGNQAGISTIYQPAGICPNWPAWCEFTPEETISVTSMVATGGGGLIMGFSTGHVSGAGPAFDGMNLTHLQPEEDGTYLGAGPAGLLQFSAMQAPLQLPAQQQQSLIDAFLHWWSTWSTGGGGKSWFYADYRPYIVDVGFLEQYGEISKKWMLATGPRGEQWDLSPAEQDLVKSVAFQAMRDAYKGYNVTFTSGNPSAPRHIYVKNEAVDIKVTSKAATGYTPFGYNSDVYFPTVWSTLSDILATAQKDGISCRGNALDDHTDADGHVVIGCLKTVKFWIGGTLTEGLSREQVLRALGQGIGNTVAHEVGHQAPLPTFTADVAATICEDCYDTGNDLLPHFFGALHWSPFAKDRMSRQLSRK